MAEFRSPQTVPQALDDLRGERALVLAGGTQLALLLKNGLLDAEVLVWIGRIKELRQIEVDADRLVIGAAVTLAEVSRSREVRRLHPALADAAGHIGNPRVRASATLGGHLAHADPRQDLPPLLLALGARVEIAGSVRPRRLPLSELFTGFMETALDDGELITAVEVPVPRQGQRAAYVRFAPQSASDYAAVGVAASLTLGDGDVIEAAIALGSGSAWPRLVPSASKLVLGRPDSQAIALAAQEVEAAADPTTDQRGSVAYKKEMVRLSTRRVLERLLTHTSRLSA